MIFDSRIEYLYTLNYIKWWLVRFNRHLNLNQYAWMQFNFHIISNFLRYFQIDGSSSRPQSMEGPMDSGISLNGDTISSPDSDNSSQLHMQNQSVRTTSSLYFFFCDLRHQLEIRRCAPFNPSQQAKILILNFFLFLKPGKKNNQDIETKKDFRSKRCHVLTELLETERIYVAEMGSILRVSTNIHLDYKLLFIIRNQYIRLWKWKWKYREFESHEKQNDRHQLLIDGNCKMGNTQKMERMAGSFNSFFNIKIWD